MAFTNYHTVNGKLIAESVGATKRGCVLDALGSVTSVIDETGNVIAKFLYQAFGTSYQLSGAPLMLRFGWCGSWGYRTTASASGTSYIRNRTYDPRLCFWTSRDLLWPQEHPYEYTRSRPTVYVDHSGIADSTKCRCRSSVTTKYKRQSTSLTLLVPLTPIFYYMTVEYFNDERETKIVENDCTHIYRLRRHTN